MNLTRLYKMFHGHAVETTRRVLFPKPKGLVCLGDAVEIVYRTDKLNGGGDGKMAEYCHKFARGAKLYCDEKGEKWLFIQGDKIRVREPGIIN